MSPQDGPRAEAVMAKSYDIVPTVAAPHSTSINAITCTPDLRWVFSGGADGYIRKFDWLETANGKVMLTVAQRHQYVDSVIKAGVLLSYWENEEPQLKSPISLPADEDPSLSPVYSLAVHSQALWLLSGLELGGINLQSIRHDEGKRIVCLKKHRSAVSVLTLSEDEKSVLSGSWDKVVYDWDLNTGQARQEFRGSGGQISAIELRPASSLPVPELTEDASRRDGTMIDSNNAEPSWPNGVADGLSARSEAAGSRADEDGRRDHQRSPAHSLFSGNDADSLFEDYDDKAGMTALPENAFPDEDDEFSRAIANGFQQHDAEVAAEGQRMAEAALFDRPSEALDARHGETGPSVRSDDGSDATMVNPSERPSSLSNGLPHGELDSPSQPVPDGLAGGDDMRTTSSSSPPSSSSSPVEASHTTFLAASIDGTLRVWDRRLPVPVATILPKNVPPWCMNACWSPDGNTIYAGRRNGTVEEYHLHKGLRQPERTFRFPQGSGPVSAIKAMPNGRHLVCASFDILRLYDLQEQPASSKHSTVPFLIIPGHRGGVISTLHIDPTCRYLMSAAGNRGWEGSTTEAVLGYEIGTVL